MPAISAHIFAIAGATRCNVFVESGTYYGASFEKALQSGVFERCYSVEIVPELHRPLNARFPARANRQVFLGRSYEVFAGQIFPQCSSDDRIFFWLDGHFSAGVTGGSDFPCPLLDELEAIRQHCPARSLVIAIDDTDDLGKRNAEVPGNNWPTREEVQAAAAAIRPDFVLLDYTGHGDRPKMGRGTLIYAYMRPGARQGVYAVWLPLRWSMIRRNRAVRTWGRRGFSRLRRMAARIVKPNQAT